MSGCLLPNTKHNLFSLIILTLNITSFFQLLACVCIILNYFGILSLSFSSFFLETHKIHEYKHNIGWYWIKKTHCLGCAWVVRDANGNAIWHSRRSFADIANLSDAKRRAMCWAIESMVAHRVEKVIFGIEDPVVCGFLDRPKAWPSFWYESSVLLDLLSNLPRWRTNLEVKETNKGAFLIAKSATNISFAQSYEAVSHPRWLTRLFDSEKVGSSA